MRRLALASAAVLMAAPSFAVEIEQVDVARKDARYHVALRVRLDAPATASWAAFANPLHLPRINPDVREVRLLDARGAEQLRAYTLVEVCVALYCRRLEQVQDLRYEHRAQGGVASAEVLPALSDFRYGRARWVFRACEQRTCLDFEAELEPAFWVPPLIGPWLIQRKLREEAIETSQGLERLAREMAP